MGQEKEIAFEEALKKLESIVDRLEDGELSLEDALKAYEEGVRLADLCSKRLTEAEKRVEVLTKMQNGRLKSAPLEGEEDASKGKKKK